MKNCIFCHSIKEEQILYQTEHFQIVLDIDPIQAGHLLIISKEHYQAIQELPASVLFELVQLEQKLTAFMETTYQLYGTSLIRNNAGAMDKGVHFHSHLIPRYQHDYFWKHVTPTPHPFDLNKLKLDLKNLDSLS